MKLGAKEPSATYHLWGTNSDLFNHTVSYFSPSLGVASAGDKRKQIYHLNRSFQHLFYTVDSRLADCVEKH